jgi:transposase
MNPTSKSSLPAVLDPVACAMIAQLQQKVEVKDQALAAAEAIIQQLKEALRLERVRKYGSRSEKLSDLQLEFLDLEPAVSSDEIETEAASGPLSEDEQNAPLAAQQQQKKRKPHPGRNELPAHLERVEQIVPCAVEQCTCGKCGGATRVIGYEETEVLAMKPSVYFVRVVKREKRACTACVTQGIATAPAPVRIAPKSILADETILSILIDKYCSSIPLFRQRAILLRDLGLDVALTTINDAVLRVGEMLIPVVDAMKRDLLASGYVQADETHVGVQTPDKKGHNHRAYFWQYSSPGRGVVFDFEMTRSGEVPRKVFKDYSGILHTDGYAGYGDDVGARGMIHVCCLAHARRKFIEALKTQIKGKATDAELERVVVLIDGLFSIDREAHEQKLSPDDRHALRLERAPVLLDELAPLLKKMKTRLLPRSAAGSAVAYTLRRWEKLTRFLDYPVIELSTNWAENSMRPIALGRKNWLQIGSKNAGPKIAAIFSIVESCRKLGVPIRQYLADVLPGLADRSILSLAELNPAAYAAKIAK